ncbi:MAG: signal peptidase I [Micrococcales bacterium]|nr:signal peptidase I [Micrococcales bacterium]
MPDETTREQMTQTVPPTASAVAATLEPDLAPDGDDAADALGDALGDPAKGPSALGRWGREVGFVVLAALVLSFVLKTFFIQSFYIPSQSMESTLLKEDRVMVTKLAPGPFGVHRGDVVVFSDPGGWLNSSPELTQLTGASAWIHGALQAIGLAPMSEEAFLIKRVIGVGGDTVECVITGEGFPADGVIEVNGVELHETYVKEGESPCLSPFRVTVPEDALWLMGDNRGNSGDSRFHDQGPPLHGAVQLKAVVGVAKLRTWPLNRITFMKNPGSVFKDVPEPTDQGKDDQ